MILIQTRLACAVLLFLVLLLLSSGGDPAAAAAAAAAAARTTAHERARVAELRQVFRNLDAAVGAFFNNMEERYEARRADGALAPWHHDYAKEMFRHQREAVAEVFAPARHVEPLLVEVRARRAAGEDAAVLHRQQGEALHELIDAMASHSEHVQAHLQHKDELFSLLEEQEEKRVAHAAAARAEGGMRFRATHAATLSAEASSRLAVAKSALSQLWKNMKWLMGVIGRFLRTVLKSLFLGVGFEITTHGGGYVLEACVDIGTWVRFYHSRPLNSNEGAIAQAEAAHHAQTHSFNSARTECPEGTTAKAAKLLGCDLRVGTAFVETVAKSGSDDDDGGGGGGGGGDDDGDSDGRVEQDIVAATSAIQQPGSSEDASGDDERGQLDMVDEIVDRPNHDDQHGHSKQTFEQARTAGQTKRHLSFLRHVMSKTFNAKNGAIEAKLCFPLVMEGLHPHSWGMNFVANSVLLKAIKETLSNIVGRGVSEVLGTTDARDAEKAYKEKKAETSSGHGHGHGDLFLQLQEDPDHAEIADEMSPPDGITVSSGMYKGSLNPEPTGKFCRAYCKPIEGQLLCFPKNNKNYKDSYLRDDVLTLAKYQESIPDEAARRGVWNQINYCANVCVDVEHGPHAGECGAERDIVQFLMAANVVSRESLIPEGGDEEVGGGDLNSADEACRAHDGQGSACCKQAACGYDTLVDACRAKNILEAGGHKDSCTVTAMATTPMAVDRDILTGLEKKCNGDQHRHDCEDTIAMVLNIFSVDKLGAHMFHGVGFDYSMRSCGPFFSKGAMSKLSNAFPKGVGGTDLSTRGEATGPSEKEKAAKEEIETQQLLDKVARTQEDIERGQCSPNCANVEMLHSLVIIAPWYVTLGRALAVGYKTANRATSDASRDHHEAEANRGHCIELKEHIFTLSHKPCEPPLCQKYQEDLDDLQAAWDEVCVEAGHEHGGLEEGEEGEGHHGHNGDDDTHGGPLSESSILRSSSSIFEHHRDMHHRTGGRAGQTVDDTGIAERILKERRSERASLRQSSSPAALLLLQANENQLRSLRKRSHGGSVPEGGSAGAGDGTGGAHTVDHHNHHNSFPAGMETVMSFGPVYDIGKCLFQKMRTFIVGAALKAAGAQDRLCKEPCTPPLLGQEQPTGTCPTLKIPNYGVQNTKPNGRYSETKEKEATCTPLWSISRRLKHQKEKGICSHCKGPGSPCRYDTDCASSWCKGNGFGAFQGSCTDMGRLAGTPCARDNECASKNCRRGVRGYGVCSNVGHPNLFTGPNTYKEKQPSECIPNHGRAPGCPCGKNAQCRSNVCGGDAVSLAFGRGACQFTELPVLTSCHEASDCEKCATATAHGSFGVHPCVWSIGEVQDQPEKWPGADNGEVSATRVKEGCYAEKGSRNWKEQRYIDAEHKGMCGKTPEHPRAAKIKRCSMVTAEDGCLACVNQDVQTGILLTHQDECVWSIGVPVGGKVAGHENWDAFMSDGQKKLGSKKVTRKPGKDGGPRCVRKKPSEKSWIMNRYIDREHKDLCGKTPALTPGVVEDQAATEREKCELLTYSGRDAESKCKKECNANPNCKGTVTKSRYVSFQNKCTCAPRAALREPGWKRASRRLLLVETRTGSGPTKGGISEICPSPDKGSVACCYFHCQQCFDQCEANKEESDRQEDGNCADRRGTCNDECNGADGVRNWGTHSC